MNFSNIDLKRWGPPLIAIGIALIGMVYYVASGRSSLNLNTRELEKSGTVEKTVPTGNNTLTVKCKNGETYQIIYKEGQTNFQDLVYNRCGAAGAESSTNP